jgi:hypothetical protein
MPYALAADAIFADSSGHLKALDTAVEALPQFGIWDRDGSIAAFGEALDDQQPRSAVRPRLTGP